MPRSSYVDWGIKIGSSFCLILKDLCSCRDVEYVQGVVYCSLGHNNVIGAFNAALKQWKILPYPLNENKFIYDFLIDSGSADNNNLLIAILECEKTYIVYRFDPFGMKWSQVKSNLLKNKSLFLGFTSSCLQVEDEDHTSEFRNTIHNFQLCYSDGGIKCPQILQFYDWISVSQQQLLDTFWI